MEWERSIAQVYSPGILAAAANANWGVRLRGDFDFILQLEHSNQASMVLRLETKS